MLPKTSRTAFMHFLIVASLVLFASTFASAQTVEEATGKVNELFNQKRFDEAVPYLEIIVKAKPDDAEAHFLYGFALFAKSKRAEDPESDKMYSEKALAAFKKAKELGLKEETNDKMIALLSADAASVKDSFSKNAEANKMMNQAESSFARGEYDKAYEFYQKALALDPNIYEAALFSGDVFVQKGEYKTAETWYQKAITIDPMRETAYRYSATPLMKQSKYNEARDRYVEAYITEPYSELALRGLLQWGQVTGTRLGHPKLSIPANVGTGANGDINITLGIQDDTGDGSFVWTAYGLARAAWQSGKSGLSDNFKKAYPSEKEYRHSLAEEYDALKMTVTVLKERMNDKKSPIKALNPQFETLIKIYDEGLLESYILLAKSDAGIAKDHPAYLKQNREKMRQYVVKYVIGSK